MAARGLVEGTSVVQGGGCDLALRDRRSERAQQARRLAVVRGEHGGVGGERAEKLGDEVECPRVDDERHAGLSAELGEFERVLAALLVQAGPDERRLNASPDHDDARLVGQHEVLDAPRRVEAHHTHARGECPARGENTRARIGVGAGNEANNAARVLVVRECGNGHGGVGTIFIVVVVDVACADRSVSVGTRARGHLTPIHTHQPHLAGVFDGGRQDLRALVGANREGVRGPQNRTADRAVVIGEARRYIDGNHFLRVRAHRVVQTHHRIRELAREGTA